MINCPSLILMVTFTSLLIWIYLFPDGRICSTMAFLPLGKSVHVVISDSIGFPLNSKEDALFHPIDYDYSHTDFCDFKQSISHADFRQSL